VRGTRFLIRARRFLVVGDQVSGGWGPGFWSAERGFGSTERGFWFGRTRFLVRETRFLLGRTRFLIRGTRFLVRGTRFLVRRTSSLVPRTSSTCKVSKFKPYRAHLGGETSRRGLFLHWIPLTDRWAQDRSCLTDGVSCEVPCLRVRPWSDLVIHHSEPPCEPSRMNRMSRGDARNVVRSNLFTASIKLTNPRRAARSITPSVPETASPRSLAA